jgi:hypothetical protein
LERSNYLYFNTNKGELTMKKKEAVVFHQHRTAKIVFGKAHPVNGKHGKESTQKAHEITIELDKG